MRPSLVQDCGWKFIPLFIDAKLIKNFRIETFKSRIERYRYYFVHNSPFPKKIPEGNTPLDTLRIKK